MEEKRTLTVDRPSSSSSTRSVGQPAHGQTNREQDSTPTIYGAVTGAVNSLRLSHGILDQIEQSINPAPTTTGNKNPEGMGGLVSVADDARESADYLVKRLQSLRDVLGG